MNSGLVGFYRRINPNPGPIHPAIAPYFGPTVPETRPGWLGLVGHAEADDGVAACSLTPGTLQACCWGKIMNLGTDTRAGSREFEEKNSGLQE